MALVNFVIGGAQKAGTTALHAILSQNQDIFLPSTKELHFFDRDAHFEATTWEEAVAGYEANFAARGDARCAGDATPAYLWTDVAVERIARYNPAMKWIVSLRDPRQRAVSQWQMQVELGSTSMTFEEAIAREIRLLFDGSQKQRPGANYISQGMYSRQIDRLVRLFGRKNVLVIIHDDFVADFSGTMAGITDFLCPGTTFDYQNAYVGMNALRPPCKPDTIELLGEIFKDDIAILERRLGVDLGAWKQRRPTEMPLPVERRVSEVPTVRPRLTRRG